VEAVEKGLKPGDLVRFEVVEEAAVVGPAGPAGEAEPAGGHPDDPVHPAGSLAAGGIEPLADGGDPMRVGVGEVPPDRPDGKTKG
jgi:hypothetical protein